MIINSKNNLHFGMSYKMINDANCKIAQHIHETFNPKYMEDSFIKIANELKTLKTEVIADGDDVFVKDSKGNIYEVLDKAPKLKDDKNVNYPVKNRSNKLIKNIEHNFPIYYKNSQSTVGSPAWSSTFLYSGPIRKHANALEIGKELDRQMATNSTKLNDEVKKYAEINSSAKKLQDLFG